MEARVMGINFESLVDGDGVRVTVFFSGCKHHCSGCHNPASHDFGNGRPFTEQLQTDIIKYIQKTPFIDGITLSGGDPMYSAMAITPFVRRVRMELPTTTIWIYSGFTFEEICADPVMYELISLCDILVDGEFDMDKRGLNLRYKGSVNQRTIDIQKSLSSGRLILHE